MNDDEKELNKLAYESQLLQRNGGILNSQIETIRDSIQQYRVGAETLKAIKARGGKDALMVPLGGGAMAHAKLVDTEKILVDIGSGVVLEKTLDEAISDMERRAKEGEAAGKDMEKALLEIASKLDKNDAKAKKLIEKLRGSDQISQRE